MAARTSKSISERIEADYYKHPHPLRKARRWLSWGCLAFTLVLMGLPLVLGRQEVFQSAPVSEAHRFIGEDCSRCHTESWQPALRLVTLDESHRSVTDASCRKCHNTADHFGMLPSDPAPRCADCHREHRPETNLASTADAFCIRCHASLTQRTRDGRDLLPVGDIAEHPEFALFRSGIAVDSTSIRFNHQVHLSAEGVAGADGKKVVLDCAQCHQPDESRRRMKPVTYSAHCAQCHSNSLQFDQERFPGILVPHASPDVVRGFLREEYIRSVVEKEDPSSADRSGNAVGLPKAHDLKSAEKMKEVRQWEQAALTRLLGEREGSEPGIDKAEYQLFARSGGCRYCHEVAPAKEVAGEPTHAKATEDRWQVTPANIPDKWLHAAVFPHNSHRMLTCVACHPTGGSQKSSDVLLPTIDNCKQCHSPQIAGSIAASSHCTSCHNYHDHDKDVNFNGQLTLELSDFLKVPSPALISAPSTEKP